MIFPYTELNHKNCLIYFLEATPLAFQVHFCNSINSYQQLKGGVVFVTEIVLETPKVFCTYPPPQIGMSLNKFSLCIYLFPGMPIFMKKVPDLGILNSRLIQLGTSSDTWRPKRKGWEEKGGKRRRKEEKRRRNVDI